MRRASKAEEQKLRAGQQVHTFRSRTGAALIEVEPDHQLSEGEKCLQASFKQLLRLRFSWSITLKQVEPGVSDPGLGADGQQVSELQSKGSQPQQRTV
ncbi:hypothetical protein AOLI_G00091790 [Acnodon oligacanthus]